MSKAKLRPRGQRVCSTLICELYSIHLYITYSNFLIRINIINVANKLARPKVISRHIGTCSDISFFGYIRLYNIRNKPKQNLKPV